MRMKFLKMGNDMTVSFGGDGQPACNGLTEPSLSAALGAAPRAVLDFWLGDGLLHGWPSKDMGDRWFGAGAALDHEIAERFGRLVTQALGGGLGDWARTPPSRLALVVLLDQLPRNIHRGTAQAFAGDARAQTLALDALGRDEDAALPWVGRVFLYMPLTHAEDLGLQARCVERFERLLSEAPAALRKTLQGSLRFARAHRDIIERFGRFPHRNEVLGRTSSAAEREFLKSGPRFGQ